jgi:hypothetical protein
VPRSQRISDDETSRYRFARSDVFAVLLLIGWCALGIVKISHDVREYRAQQAAIAELATRYPAETLHLFSEPGTPIAKAPYDPASERWLFGEVVGYLLTLVVVAVGCGRARRRRVSVEVKWVPSPSRRAATRRQAKTLSPPSAAPGNVAADRLSAIVWTDRIVRRVKELA